MSGGAIASTTVSPARVLSDALRRRVWRLLFATGQRRVGPFFLDPCDHIGQERIVTGDHYEAAVLWAIGELATKLALGRGMAIDGGANIGNHACWFASRFAHVLCVEPGKVAGLVLEANLTASGSSNWEIARCALGDADGGGTLDVVNDVNLGSSRVVVTDGAASDFPVHTGDGIVARCRRAELPVTLIKLDVEGAEAPALRGLQQVLMRDQPLVCVEALDAQRWGEIRQLLSSLGYSAFLVMAPSRPGGGGWLADVLLGRRWSLTELPDAFQPGGFEMVFCLTRSQREALA